MKSRNKYLLKNTLIFTIGNFASKFISFFLIPIYTHVLSTADYGIIDLISTICLVLVPLLSFNIAESIMRFGLDKKEEYSTKILVIANKSFIVSIIIGLILFPVLLLIKSISKFSILIYLYFVSLVGTQIYLAVLKGQEKLKVYTIGNVLDTFLIAICNIILLIGLKKGIEGYFIAYIISNIIVLIYAFILSGAYKEINKKMDVDLYKKMVKYSVVLIPTSFMWWIMNSSDRIMVNSMVSTSANGIYAISYKLPTLISSIIGIFTQAWLFSAISEKNSSDSELYTNKVFKMLFIFSSFICISLLLVTKPFMKFYVSDSFYEGWKYVPFLAIGVVFQSLATFISTSYNVYKDNKGFLYSGITGAIVNIVLNFILIPKFKVYGAALATCVSYIIVYIYRLIDTRKYVKIHTNKAYFYITYFIFIVSLVFMYLDFYVSELLLLINLLILTILFYKDLLLILKKIVGRGKNEFSK